MARKPLTPRGHHPSWDPCDRIVIEDVSPELDGGRYPVKRIVGDIFEVSADIFRDGHDILAAAIKYRAVDELQWQRAPMHFVDNDRWSGRFELVRNYRYAYTIEAWTDIFESWRADTIKKRDAGQDVAVDLQEFRESLESGLNGASGEDQTALQRLMKQFDDQAEPADRLAFVLSEPVRALMSQCGVKADLTTYHRELEIVVDRKAARYAAWYEMFPRSQGSDPARSATFDDCIRRLPELREMGFDVLYFVPIHPIGRVNRKGPNNTLVAGANDPGSPYAIGSDDGGHVAIHSDLGTFADFDRLVAAARQHDMEVALDFAIQCAPDHPWVSEHPEWFRFRPDGSIKYAENPPKKYQDIVNINFYPENREELWRALRDVVLFWAERGVKTFRVDNPHTKPVPFWEWMIREVQSLHPDAIFLSEAFTRPKMLQVLGKAGFTQSYTYFTWRNFKQEFIDYLVELTQTERRQYLRPNFFTNTPDILPPILQRGGRPAFMMRLVLAATLSSVYGIYSGFELCEGTAIADTEEYLDSEKYQYKVWDWDRPGNIKDYISRVNRARRENPALHDWVNLRFLPADSDSILFYSKMTDDRTNMIFVAVNLDPFEAHEATVRFPLEDMGIGEEDAFEAEDLLSGDRHLWRGPEHRLRLDPQLGPAVIFRVTPFRHIDYRTPCY